MRSRDQFAEKSHETIKTVFLVRHAQSQNNCDKQHATTAWEQLKRSISRRYYYQECFPGMVEPPLLERISAEPKLFERFVHSNTPVIIKWDGVEKEKWTIRSLSQTIGDKFVSNVFVSSNGRFLYSKEGSANSKKARFKMLFSEFVSRASKSVTHEPLMAENEKLYLYGENMPGSLKPSVPFPKFLPSTSEDLTSTMLWVALTGNCSPIHYDMVEGVMCQMSGTKRFVLCPPSHYAQLYPFEVNSPFDRQSKVSDVLAPNLEEFPLCTGLPLIRGEVHAGEVLYIPYGWWH
eukprot:610106_1